MFSTAMKKGSVELLMLSLLEDEPLHGYQLGRLIESRSGGRLVFRISSLYPVLCRMEDRRWITGRWVEAPGKRRRRYYELTKKGRKALVHERETWLEFTRAVSRVTEPTSA